MNEKGFTHLFLPLIALLVLISGLGVTYIFNKQNQTTHNSKSNLDLTPSQTPASADINTWKTYSNEQLGISFQYPEYWPKEKFCEFGYPFCLEIIEYSKLPTKKELDCDEVGCGGDPGIILINTKEEFINFANSINNGKVPDIYNSYWGWKTTNIGERNAIQSYIYYVPSGTYSIFSVLFTRNNQNLLSLSVDLPIEPEYKQVTENGYKTVDIEKSEAKLIDIRDGIIDQKTKKVIDDYKVILSSFRFINDETANWKTYQGKYFSFKYRPDLTLEEKNNGISLMYRGTLEPYDKLFHTYISIEKNPEKYSLIDYAEKELCKDAFKIPEQNIDTTDYCNQLVKDNLKEYKNNNINGIKTIYNLFENPMYTIIF